MDTQFSQELLLFHPTDEGWKVEMETKGNRKEPSEEGKGKKAYEGYHPETNVAASPLDTIPPKWRNRERGPADAREESGVVLVLRWGGGRALSAALVPL
jgi:hypothetical protein